MNIGVSRLALPVLLLLCISSPVSGFLLLFSCPDFQDWRQTSQQNQSEWLIGRSDETPDYQIIKPNFPILTDCGATVSRYVYLSDEQNQTFVTKAGYDPKLYEQRSPQRFTKNGDYFDGFHYFQRSEYCVNSITDITIELLVCQPICSSFKTRSKTRYCVPKCCAPDEILGYWSLRCLRFRQNEPTWKPVICKDESCVQMEPFNNIHYQRHSISCATSIVRHPLTTMEIIFRGVHQVDEKDNIRMDITHGHLELQRLSEEREWKRYNIDFCVDGFIKTGNYVYTGSYENQVFLTCFDDEPIEEEVPLNYTQGWISVSTQLLGAGLFFLAAVIYLILLDRQNFNGLLILMYSISSFFAHLLYAAAHYISIDPSPEITEFIERGPICMIIAVGSHFFYFVNFSWLTVMNLTLWLTMGSMSSVSARNSKRLKPFMAYSVLAWGIPALLIASFVVVDEVYRDPSSTVVVPDYATDSCSVATWSRGYYLYAPLTVFLFVNGILIFLTFRVMLAARKNASNLDRTGADTITAKLFFKLFILMGAIAFINLFLWYFNGKENPSYFIVVKLILQLESFPIFMLFCCNERISKQLVEKYPFFKGCLIKPLRFLSCKLLTFCTNRSHNNTHLQGREGPTVASQEI